VLVGDLLAKHGWRSLGANNPDVIALSDFLRAVEIHPRQSRAADFRNPNGVARKTADVATRHPDYAGRPTNGGQHDLPVLLAFLADRDEMTRTANAIREVAVHSDLAPSDLDLDLDDTTTEGRLLQRYHLTRERDRKLRSRKIAGVLAVGQPLACEVCAFDFSCAYGDRGDGFIEVHHRLPLYVTGPVRTRQQDLALLCSNCHRMIHRSDPWLTVEELTTIHAQYWESTASHR
jgi:5-methylcytosine-specific restriction protein A